ncbi:MAG TPA: heme exporter protein CcmD [Acidiferrobacterales bacterium]|jgi:heme exporter protein D
MNWTEFFHMGGYAVYVWGSYGIAALVLVANVWAALRRRRRVMTRLRDYARANEAGNE